MMFYFTYRKLVKTFLGRPQLNNKCNELKEERGMQADERITFQRKCKDSVVGVCLTFLWYNRGYSWNGQGLIGETAGEGARDQIIDLLNYKQVFGFYGNFDKKTLWVGVGKGWTSQHSGVT